MYTLLSYSLYLLLSLFTVIVVGKKLHHEGKVFLFGECEDEQLSTSANNFLYLCYVLLNGAFALLFLQKTEGLNSLAQLIEFVAKSQGFICVSLGVLHFLNLLIVPIILRFYLKNRVLTNKNQKS